MTGWGILHHYLVSSNPPPPPPTLSPTFSLSLSLSHTHSSSRRSGGFSTQFQFSTILSHGVIHDHIKQNQVDHHTVRLHIIKTIQSTYSQSVTYTLAVYLKQEQMSTVHTTFTRTIHSSKKSAAASCAKKHKRFHRRENNNPHITWYTSFKGTFNQFLIH